MSVLRAGIGNNGNVFISPRILSRIVWLFVIVLDRSARVRFINRRPVERVVQKEKTVIEGSICAERS